MTPIRTKDDLLGALRTWRMNSTTRHNSRLPEDYADSLGDYLWPMILESLVEVQTGKTGLIHTPDAVGVETPGGKE